MQDNDDTEQYRRARCAELNDAASDSLAALRAIHGEVWTLADVRARWEIKGFMAPYVVVKERTTGKMGSLEFQHMPRFYWGWIEDK